MGSSAKTGKNFSEGHRSTFGIKVPFGIGQPPPTHKLQSICVWEVSRVPNLQTEFNYLDLFKSYCIFSDFVVPTWSLSSLSSLHHPHSPQKVPMWSPHPPWLWSVLSLPHVVPVVPTLSPSSPCHPCYPHIISTLSRRSPHDPQSCRYPPHPPTIPSGDGVPNQ